MDMNYDKEKIQFLFSKQCACWVASRGVALRKGLISLILSYVSLAP